MLVYLFIDIFIVNKTKLLPH